MQLKQKLLIMQVYSVTYFLHLSNHSGHLTKFHLHRISFVLPLYGKHNSMYVDIHTYIHLYSPTVHNVISIDRLPQHVPY